MCRNGDKTTFGVKFDLKFDFSVPNILYIEKYWKLEGRFHVVLANFLLCMCRNGHNSTSGQIFNLKSEIPKGFFPFEYEFWQRFRQYLYVFCAKNCFRNAKFSEFGGYWGWGEIIFDETPTRHILAWFHAYWAIDRANPLTGFCSRSVHEKSDTAKSHR